MHRQYVGKEYSDAIGCSILYGRAVRGHLFTRVLAKLSYILVLDWVVREGAQSAVRFRCLGCWVELNEVGCHA